MCVIPVIQGRGGSNVWQQDLVLLDLTQQTLKDASDQLWDGKEPKKPPTEANYGKATADLGENFASNSLPGDDVTHR